MGQTYPVLFNHIHLKRVLLAATATIWIQQHSKLFQPERAAVVSPRFDSAGLDTIFLTYKCILTENCKKRLGP